MRVKFTFAIALLIIATALLWRFMQTSLYRKPVAPPPVHTSSGTTAGSSAFIAAPGEHNASEANAAQHPSFVALRYDKTRVLFLVDQLNDDTLPGGGLTQSLRTLDPAVAKLGVGRLWEPDEGLLQSYQELYSLAQAGDEWNLQVSSNVRVPVVIQKPVAAELGCFLAAGFLAEVPKEQQEAFTASARQYFLISRTASSQTGQPAQVAELKGWKATPALRKQIEQLLQARLKEELPKIQADAEKEYAQFDDTTRQQWKQMDESLAHGEGKLDYDIHAFQLTPDRTPRLFLRAKWTVGDKPAFLMSLWLNTEPALAVQSLNSSASFLQRTSEFQNASLDLDFLGQVLNVFDLSGDGHGTFLFYSEGTESFDIHLYRYTDAGPEETDISLDGGC